MKSPISIILILLLISSPQYQKAEPENDDEHTTPMPLFPPVFKFHENKISDEPVPEQESEVETPSLSELHLDQPHPLPDDLMAVVKAEILDAQEESLSSNGGTSVNLEENNSEHDESFDAVEQSDRGSSPEPESATKLEENILEEKPVEEILTPPPPPERKEEDKPPSESNKSEDSIPSFSEWTKLQLAQRKESIINNIKNKTSLSEGKNFASPDCGAKIMNSNPESQNPSGVISSSHDEYMLNRCTSNIWFIVELCEPLTIERISIGNLELFSSNPHEFEVGVSDRYPTREWIVFGPYSAPDSRNMHSFHLPTNNSTFGKYLRIVVKSHHGHEHYCPLSLIKVHGRSEYEVLESETTHAQDMETDIPGITEEEMSADKPAQKSVIGTATAAVMDMVKKAAGVLVNKNMEVVNTEHSSSSTSAPPNTEASEPSHCITLSQCVPDSDSKFAVLNILSCKWNQLRWMNGLLRWCGWEDCHNFLKMNSIGGSRTPEGFLVAMFGPNVIHTLCHLKNPFNTCDSLAMVHEDMTQLNGVPNGTTNGSLGISSTQVPNDGKGNRDDIASLPSTLESPSSTNSNAASQEPVTNVHAPAPMPPLDEPAQKESVFVRLSNRIKNLERNQSLSSGYLEELSQRFRKQNEEIHSSHEQFRKTLNESLTKCTLVEQSLRYEVRKLNRNVDTLREMIWRVELQRSGLFLLSFLQIISTCIFWWSRNGQKESKIQNQKEQLGSKSETIPASECNNSSCLSPSERKRSCTIVPKQKKKRKRKDVTPLAIEAPPDPTTTRISSSLSSNSIPLRLPSPNFEFVAPTPVFNTRKILPAGSCMMPLLPPSNSIKPGISSSDVSETSTGSTPSQKKKWRLKSLFSRS